MIDLSKFIQGTVDATTRKKILRSEVIYNWSRLVDETIAEKIVPVTIEHGVLFVDVKSAAFKDQLKFYAEEIIDAINDAFAQDEPLVREIRIAKGYQIADKLAEENSRPAPPESEPVTLNQITLTDEERQRCEAAAEKISDKNLRRTVLRSLTAQTRVQKFRAANGWHKCKRCATLCPPEEIFCEVCRVQAHEAMVAELFKILYDEPWLDADAAQKILLERMPLMQTECSPDVVESARTSLIQRVASGVKFGDEESSDVLKLVMLEKRLPPDKLTPAIIRRALIDLQFNLAEQPKLQRYFRTLRKLRK